ncbi:MAG: sigma 54-interacting transcriptional regulator [Deltaproteobacteria bacterium]|nr:sigma 54-interacting transcriptional regulator [Deltaproteobacteria bacterium]
MSSHSEAPPGATRRLGEHERLHSRLGRGLVRVESGPDRGREASFSGLRLTAGRAAVNDLRLDDDAVSGAHFELRLSQGGVCLRDLGSTNGTFLGEARLGEAWIEPGAVFRAGTDQIRLVAAEPVEVPISQDDRFEELSGQSPAMRELFSLLARIAPTPMDVLVGGETGTGKELVARALHARSPRRDGPLVVLDCAALPRELAEAAILGHRRGSFTGAVEDRAGCFERADGGTVFLDEVGELSLELQPKLLRVLERREVLRIGDDRSRTVDVRVVAATHRDLRRMVADGEFREDLYFRLADVAVELPPLRDRGADVVLLAERFVEELAGERPLRLSSGAKAALDAEAWPGNVRELRRAIRRAVFLAEGSRIDRADIAPGLYGPHAQRRGGAADELFSLPFRDARQQFEEGYFRALLAETAGNLSEAARRSGYSRQGLRERLRRLELYEQEA